MMVKQKIKKGRLRKRQIKMDIPASQLILQGGIGVLLGAATAVLCLILSALIMKLSAVNLSSAGGWVLGVKLIASAVGAVISAYGGGKIQGLRGAGTGAIILLIVNLIFSFIFPFRWTIALADTALGAAAGFASGTMLSVIK